MKVKRYNRPLFMMLIAFAMLSYGTCVFAAKKTNDCSRRLAKKTGETKTGDKTMPPKSSMMDELYGHEVADKVYARLQELDPDLNEEIQRVAYDHFWARPGLNTRDKSLVTVASLIALGKEEQTRIHMNGFLGAGGTVDELKMTLVHLSVVSDRESAVNGKVALLEVLGDRRMKRKQIEALSQELDELFGLVRTEDSAWTQPGLNLRDKNLISVAAAVAAGKQEKTQVALGRFLADGGSMDDLKNIMIHQIVYCGFPATMNGFAALQDVLHQQSR